MKISCAAARHCRVLVWFLGVALAPLFGQTDDHGTTATTATLVNANTTGAIDTTASLRNGLDAEIASGDDRGTYPNCRATVALTSGNGDVAPSRTRAVELDFQSQRRASKGGRRPPGAVLAASAEERARRSRSTSSQLHISG